MTSKKLSKIKTKKGRYFKNKNSKAEKGDIFNT